MPKTTRFDAADYLGDEERQVAYITAALETGDANFVRDALGIVARARGMGEIARNAGLNRESLYKGLAKPATPNSARSCASSAPWDSRCLPVPQKRHARPESAGWHEGCARERPGVVNGHYPCGFASGAAAMARVRK
jgi:probable addiction module antidote protein